MAIRTDITRSFINTKAMLALSSDYIRLGELQNEISLVSEQLEEAMANWEKLAEESEI